MHRRRIATLAVAGLLALAGCGDEAADTANDAQTQAEEAVEGARTQAEEAVEQGRDAVEGFAPADAVRETRELVDDIGGSAEQLVQNPDANVDQELADAEQRARELSQRAERELQGADQELGQALGTVNDRLADTAADLQEITDPEEARQVIEEDLSQVSDELRSATAQEVPDDVRRQLEQARDRVDELQRELPSIGG